MDPACGRENKSLITFTWWLSRPLLDQSDLDITDRLQYSPAADGQCPFLDTRQSLSDTRPAIRGSRMLGGETDPLSMVIERCRVERELNPEWMGCDR